MAMVGGRARLMVMAVIGVRMEMPAADDRQQLRLVAASRRLDMLMMPAAADERMHEQRGGGEVGDESTHARKWLKDGETNGVSHSSDRRRGPLKLTSSLIGKLSVGQAF